MPYIPDDIIEQIRERADIVDIIGSFVQLRKRGEDYWGCCPFHKEKTPSFKVNSQRQAFYCFGCRKSGNIFHFIQELESMDFVGAVRWLAHRVGVHIPEPAAGDGSPAQQQEAERRRRERDAGFSLLERTAQWYNRQLATPEARAAREYLQGRGIDEKAIEDFGLGYAPDSWDATIEWAQRQGYEKALIVRTGLAVSREEQPERCYDRFRNRLMFPIRDELGRVVGFSGRVLDADAKTAKYVNTPETPFFQKSRILYGLHLARQSFRDHGAALVCEGQLDVIACHRAELTHAVSAQGTAFTEQHARLLSRSIDAVTIAFDADTAGEKAAVRTIDILHQAGVSVRVVAFAEGEDPDSIFRKRGPEVLRDIMAGGKEAIPFVFDVACRRHDMSTSAGKSAAVHDVLATVKMLPDPVARAVQCQWLSQQLNLPQQAVHDLLANLLQKDQRRTSRHSATEPGPADKPALPAFSIPSGEDQILKLLLDLALNIRQAAEQILHELPGDMVPETPLGQALNRVLGNVAQGEWALAAEDVSADHELAANEDVGRILAQSACGHLDPENAGKGRKKEALRRMRQATMDCIARLKTREIERQITDTKRALAEAEDREDARTLQMQLLELQNRRRQLLHQAPNG